MKMRCLAVLALVALVVGTCVAPAFAGGHTPFTYQVTVTSLTGGAADFNHSGEPGGEYFAPIFMMTQDGSIPLFTPGQAPSDALAEVAEAGSPKPLVTLYTGNSDVGDTMTTASPMLAGTSTTFTIQGGPRFNYFSMAAMLFPTNDEFMGLSLRKLPLPGHTQVYWANAWDADSKPDNELCADMPSPAPMKFPIPQCTTSCSSNNDCIPNPPVPTGAEVHISQGIHGIGDLPADVYDWRNPVAMVTITNLAGEPHRRDR